MSRNEYSSNVLLCDSYNVYLRAYHAYPQMSASSGVQVGGVVGYIKTLIQLVKKFSPSRVYIIWESGGSNRRRNLYSEYKRGIVPAKLNRFYEDDIPDTTENRVYQIAVLAKLLKYLPFCQIYVQDCEGDDVIAYMTKKLPKDQKKIIISTDRDYYQLLGDDVEIYNPTKKAIITFADVMNEFHVSHKNFALAKAVCGDVSDNVPGVQGVGYKTISKKFPILMSDVDVLVEDFLLYAAARKEESAYYRKIYENADLVKRNWKLVYLDTTMLSPHQIQRIDYMIDSCKLTLNKLEFIKLLTNEGIVGLSIEDICYTFMKLNSH